jgi:hypothetical protein
VYGTFKRFLNLAMDSWMKFRPGTRMTIYSIPEIVVIPFTQAATPRNVLSGFAVTGIWPFNGHIVEDSEFASCDLTDVTNTNFRRGCISSPNRFATSLIDTTVGLVPVVSTRQTTDIIVAGEQQMSSVFSPEVVWPARGDLQLLQLTHTWEQL